MGFFAFTYLLDRGGLGLHFKPLGKGSQKYFLKYFSQYVKEIYFYFCSKASLKGLYFDVSK